MLESMIEGSYDNLVRQFLDTHRDIFGASVAQVTKEIWTFAFLIVQSHCFQVRVQGIIN
jgi:uncharacterized protein (DUF697 family)